MRVYYFTSSKFGLQNIANNQLKVSTFDRLNDPFELFCVEMSDSDVRENLKVQKRSISKSMGILCFSEDWRNPVQWGHYAQNHTGICLGFDIPDSELCKVNYVPRRLDASELHQPYTSTLIISTKFNHWSYEKEHRIVLGLSSLFNFNGLYFKAFDQNMILREVIIGCESEVTAEDIIAALPEKNGQIAIKYTRAAFRNFRIVQNRHKKIVHA